MASQLELAQDSFKVRRTQFTGSTRRLAARGEPDQLFAGRFILVAFNHVCVAAKKHRLFRTCQNLTLPSPLE
jgi:hypothetical protein